MKMLVTGERGKKLKTRPPHRPEKMGRQGIMDRSERMMKCTGTGMVAARCEV